MTDEERQELEKEEDKFLKECREEENEISIDDDDDLARLKEHEFEILTNHYPYGLSILEDEIEKLEDEILKIIPSPNE